MPKAKILNDRQLPIALGVIATHRYAVRDRVIFLLSCKAGLRACEIARLTWGMVRNETTLLELPANATKGEHGARSIPVHRDLKAALEALRVIARDVSDDAAVVRSERGRSMTENAVARWFFDLYARLGWEGYSSHSGRRTFVTNAARKAITAGGSLRDVQELAGHRYLSTTQAYIEGDSNAKRRLIDLI